MHSRTRSTAAVAALAIAAGARLAGLAGPAHAAQSTLPINLRRAVAYRRVNTNTAVSAVAGGSGRSSSAYRSPGPYRDQRLTRRQRH